MVGSEAQPWAKTGGLADVLGSLPRALARHGHAVDLVLPRYRGVPPGLPAGDIAVDLGGRRVEGTVSVHADGPTRVVLVDHAGYFDREHLYGVGSRDYPDNPERYAFLAQAALAWAGAAGASYDVVHAHDWQAGLVPLWLRRGVPRPPPLTGAVVVQTVHNLAYQGVFDASWLPRLGLAWDLLRVEAIEYWGRVSFLKAGVVFADRVTTVSPGYAGEIRTPAGGCGFDGILRARGPALVGILNGIDYDQWDPATDVHLPAHYDASNLEGKQAVKRAVLEAFGLPVGGDALARPLVGLVSRLVDQKGFDLLAAAADELPRLGAAFVLLGTGERRYEDQWLALAARYPDRIGVRIGFDEATAHRIEAGADLFLMPSRFEPCGLNQMYSLRYGTLPVVRATGGLGDTVRNLDPATGEGTGFTFDEASPQAVIGTLRWALEAYRNRPLWRRMQAAGMRQDFSWDASAAQYVRLYGLAREN
jgi:starch synthase